MVATVVDTEAGPVAMVSGTVDETPSGVPVSAIDGNYLVTGFLIIIGILAVALVAVVIIVIYAQKDSTPSKVLTDSINSMLQTGYNRFQEWGAGTKDTVTPADDIAFMIGNWSLSAVNAKLKERGFQLILYDRDWETL